MYKSSAAVLMTVGTIFLVVSVYFFYSAFLVPTTVPNPYPSPGLEQVSNLQLMHIQSSNFLLAVGAAIVSSIFLCSSAIVAALHPADGAG